MGCLMSWSLKEVLARRRLILLFNFFIVYAINNWQRTNRIVIARKKGTWLASTVWTDFKNILLELGLYNNCRINNTLKTSSFILLRLNLSGLMMSRDFMV